MSERGLLAPLSPHEEVTLRHVALGIANPADLAARDVERLRALMLVEEHETTLRRTAVGKQRYRDLPNSAAFDSGAPDAAPGKDGRVHQQGA